MLQIPQAASSGAGLRPQVSCCLERGFTRREGRSGACRALVRCWLKSCSGIFLFLCTYDPFVFLQFLRRSILHLWVWQDSFLDIILSLLSSRGRRLQRLRVFFHLTAKKVGKPSCSQCGLWALYQLFSALAERRQKLPDALKVQRPRLLFDVKAYCVRLGL